MNKSFVVYEFGCFLLLLLLPCVVSAQTFTLISCPPNITLFENESAQNLGLMLVAGNTGRVVFGFFNATANPVSGATHPSGLFSISNGGVLATIRPMDADVVARETAFLSFNLTLRALDTGSQVSLFCPSVFVLVRDRNDNAPVILSAAPQRISLPESLAAPAIVLTVNVTDADHPETNNFTLIPATNNTIPPPFAVQGLSLILNPLNALFKYTGSIFSFNVSVSDGINVSPQPLNVTITVGPSGSWIGLERTFINTSVFETACPSGVPIAILAPALPSMRLNFSITNATSTLARSLFRIDLTTGAITTQQALYFNASQRSYNLSVSAVDATSSGRPPLNATVIVNVLDANNNAPTFQTPPSSLQFFLPLSSSTVLFQPTVADLDDPLSPNSQVNFALFPQPSPFTINASTGAIRVSSTNTSNIAAGIYFLTLVATDGGSPSLGNSLPINITLIESVARPPLSLAVSIDTSLAPGAILLTLSDYFAVESNCVYSSLSSNQLTFGYSDVSVLLVNRNLSSRTTFTFFTINLTVNCTGFSQLVVLSLLTLPPSLGRRTFNQTTFSLSFPANALQGRTIGFLSPNPAIVLSGGMFSPRFVAGGGQDLFLFENTTGAVTLNRSASSITSNVFSMIVADASASNTFPSLALVSISRSAPRAFTSSVYTAYVPFHTSLDALTRLTILSLTATMNDLASLFTIALCANVLTALSSRFRVDPRSGALRVTSVFFFDPTPAEMISSGNYSYQFPVCILSINTNAVVSSATVTVLLPEYAPRPINVNLFPTPVFDPTTLTVTAFDNDPAGAPLGRVVATLPQCPSLSLSYSFTSSLFNLVLNSTTGVVSLGSTFLMRLSFSSSPMFFGTGLRAQASNNLSWTVSSFVLILKEFNRGVDSFALNGPPSSIVESTQAQYLGILNANDFDVDVNNKNLTLSISSAASSDPLHDVSALRSLVSINQQTKTLWTTSTPTNPLCLSGATAVLTFVFKASDNPVGNLTECAARCRTHVQFNASVSFADCNSSCLVGAASSSPEDCRARVPLAMRAGSIGCKFYNGYSTSISISQDFTLVNSQSFAPYFISPTQTLFISPSMPKDSIISAFVATSDDPCPTTFDYFIEPPGTSLFILNRNLSTLRVSSTSPYPLVAWAGRSVNILIRAVDRFTTNARPAFCNVTIVITNFTLAPPLVLNLASPTLNTNALPVGYLTRTSSVTHTQQFGFPLFFTPPDKAQTGLFTPLLLSQPFPSVRISTSTTTYTNGMLELNVKTYLLTPEVWPDSPVINVFVQVHTARTPPDAVPSNLELTATLVAVDTPVSLVPLSTQGPIPLVDGRALLTATLVPEMFNALQITDDYDFGIVVRLFSPESLNRDYFVHGNVRVHTERLYGIQAARTSRDMQVVVPFGAVPGPVIDSATMERQKQECNVFGNADGPIESFLIRLNLGSSLLQFTDAVCPPDADYFCTFSRPDPQTLVVAGLTRDLDILNNINDRTTRLLVTIAVEPTASALSLPTTFEETIINTLNISLNATILSFQGTSEAILFPTVASAGTTTTTTTTTTSELVNAAQSNSWSPVAPAKIVARFGLSLTNNGVIVFQNPNAPFAIVGLPGSSKLVNTAVLTGTVQMFPLALFVLTQSGNTIPLSSSSISGRTCVSSNPAVLSVTANCSHMFFTGREISGASSLTIAVKTNSELAHSFVVQVWYPVLPVTLEVGDTVLNLIHNLTIPEAAGTVCAARYQSTRLTAHVTFSTSSAGSTNSPAVNFPISLLNITSSTTNVAISPQGIIQGRAPGTANIRVWVLGSPNGFLTISVVNSPAVRVLSLVAMPVSSFGVSISPVYVDPHFSQMSTVTVRETLDLSYPGATAHLAVFAYFNDTNSTFEPFDLTNSPSISVTLTSPTSNALVLNGSTLTAMRSGGLSTYNVRWFGRINCSGSLFELASTNFTVNATFSTASNLSLSRSSVFLSAVSMANNPNVLAGHPSAPPLSITLQVFALYGTRWINVASSVAVDSPNSHPLIITTNQTHVVVTCDTPNVGTVNVTFEYENQIRNLQVTIVRSSGFVVHTSLWPTDPYDPLANVTRVQTLGLYSNAVTETYQQLRLRAVWVYPDAPLAPTEITNSANFTLEGNSDWKLTRDRSNNTILTVGTNHSVNVVAQWAATSMITSPLSISRRTPLQLTWAFTLLTQLQHGLQPNNVTGYNTLASPRLRNTRITIKFVLLFSDSSARSDATLFNATTGQPLIPGLLTWVSSHPSVLSPANNGANVFTLLANSPTLVNITVRGATTSGREASVMRVACNLDADVGDVDIGALDGLPVTIGRVNETVTLPVYINTGALALGSFDILLFYNRSTMVFLAASISKTLDAAQGLLTVAHDADVGQLLLGGAPLLGLASPRYHIANISFRLLAATAPAVWGTIRTLNAPYINGTAAPIRQPYSAIIAGDLRFSPSLISRRRAAGSASEHSDLHTHHNVYQNAYSTNTRGRRTIAPGSATTPCASPPCFNCAPFGGIRHAGDVNFDCVLNILDASYLQTYLVEKAAGFQSANGRVMALNSTTERDRNFDVNQDGVVDMNDVQFLMQANFDQVFFVSSFSIRHSQGDESECTTDVELLLVSSGNTIVSTVSVKVALAVMGVNASDVSTVNELQTRLDEIIVVQGNSLPTTIAASAAAAGAPAVRVFELVVIGSSYRLRVNTPVSWAALGFVLFVNASATGDNGRNTITSITGSPLPPYTYTAPIDFSFRFTGSSLPVSLRRTLGLTPFARGDTNLFATQDCINTFVPGFGSTRIFNATAGSPVGTFIGIIEGLDGSQRSPFVNYPVNARSSTLTYSLVSGNMSDFAISSSTGELTAAVPLCPGQYNFSVCISDQNMRAPRSSTAMFTVNVLPALTVDATTTAAMTTPTSATTTTNTSTELIAIFSTPRALPEAASTSASTSAISPTTPITTMASTLTTTRPATPTEGTLSFTVTSSTFAVSTQSFASSSRPLTTIAPTPETAAATSAMTFSSSTRAGATTVPVSPSISTPSPSPSPSAPILVGPFTTMSVVAETAQPDPDTLPPPGGINTEDSRSTTATATRPGSAITTSKATSFTSDGDSRSNTPAPTSLTPTPAPPTAQDGSSSSSKSLPIPIIVAAAGGAGLLLLVLIAMLLVLARRRRRTAARRLFPEDGSHSTTTMKRAAIPPGSREHGASQPPPSATVVHGWDETVYSLNDDSHPGNHYEYAPVHQMHARTLDMPWSEAVYSISNPYAVPLAHPAPAAASVSRHLPSGPYYTAVDAAGQGLADYSLADDDGVAGAGSARATGYYAPIDDLATVPYDTALTHPAASTPLYAMPSTGADTAPYEQPSDYFTVVEEPAYATATTAPPAEPTTESGSEGEKGPRELAGYYYATPMDFVMDTRV